MRVTRNVLIYRHEELLNQIDHEIDRIDSARTSLDGYSELVSYLYRAANELYLAKMAVYRNLQALCTDHINT